MHLNYFELLYNVQSLNKPRFLTIKPQIPALKNRTQQNQPLKITKKIFNKYQKCNKENPN